jgi:hypothetical protein
VANSIVNILDPVNSLTIFVTPYTQTSLTLTRPVRYRWGFSLLFEVGTNYGMGELIGASTLELGLAQQWRSSTFLEFDNALLLNNGNNGGGCSKRALTFYSTVNVRFPPSLLKATGSEYRTRHVEFYFSCSSPLVDIRKPMPFPTFS